MATPNYHLHQWERGDRPTRSDFNEDFRTIDTALHGTHQQAERGLEGVERVGYHAASLMLQRGKAGDSVRYQNGLFVEPFYNQNNISSLTGFTFDSQDKRLSLVNSGEITYNDGYGSSSLTAYPAGQAWAFGFDAEYTGQVTSLSYYATGSSSSTAVSVRLIRVSDEQQIGSIAYGPASGAYTVPLSLNIVKGVKYLFYVTNDSGQQLYSGAATSAKKMGIRYTIQPSRAESGSMLSRSLAVPEYTCARAWVRHSTGSAALSLLSGGTWHSMELEYQRTGYTVQGLSCQERTFLLNGLASSSSVQLRLDATAPSGGTTLIYEYAVMLL